MIPGDAPRANVPMFERKTRERRERDPNLAVDEWCFTSPKHLGIQPANRPSGVSGTIRGTSPRANATMWFGGTACQV